MTPDHAAFIRFLTEITDTELEGMARDYIWMAEFGRVPGRYTYELKRDQIVAECERRGRMDIVESARAKWRPR